MIFTKFHQNHLIIEGEINGKHALMVNRELRYIIISQVEPQNKMFTVTQYIDTELSGPSMIFHPLYEITAE